MLILSENVRFERERRTATGLGENGGRLSLFLFYDDRFEESMRTYAFLIHQTNQKRESRTDRSIDVIQNLKSKRAQ